LKIVDFNVWSETKFVEKLRYIHRNPVKRGLVARPEVWRWSGFRHTDRKPKSLEDWRNKGRKFASGDIHGRSISRTG
jgi:hypothetical protein